MKGSNFFLKSPVYDLVNPPRVLERPRVMTYNLKSESRVRAYTPILGSRDPP